MHLINSVAVEALLFCSLLLVVGVHVLYMTQSDRSDRRNPEIKKIEIIGGVWFHLVLLNCLLSSFV